MAALSVGVEIVGDGLDDQFLATGRPRREVAALAGRLESAGVSYWVIGAERGEAGNPATVSLDPTLVATVAARHTFRLGLVVAAAAHRDHPYNLARRLVSVDHAARGRVGWLALDFDHAIALNAATDVWTDVAPGPAHTADAVAAVRALWRTWPLESVVGERDTGVFADITRIRRADVRDGYSIAGPLNVPGSLQGDLPVWRTGAADGADAVVVEDGAPAPVGIPVVVRLRTVDGLADALDRIAARSEAAGVIVRLRAHDVGRVLDDVLPSARRRGLVGVPSGSTLRGTLGLAPPTSPDLSDHEPAFAGAPNPGGRL